MFQITTYSSRETYEFGNRLAQWLRPGDVIALIGTLGAGKTLLVQGIVAGLGAADQAISPTFTIMNVYDGQVPVYHFDLYRLDEADQLFDIGFDEYVSSQGISLIEWADKFPGQMPEEYLRIELRTEGADSRVIHVTAVGSRYQQMIEELK